MGLPKFARRFLNNVEAKFTRIIPLANRTKIYYVSRKEGCEKVTEVSSPSSFKKTDYCKENDNYFYIHGRCENPFNPLHSTQVIKSVLLAKKQEINFFIIDWNSVANNIFYFLVVNSVGLVGTILGKRILCLVQNKVMNLCNTQVVANSLGCHVAGVMGRVLGGRLKSIVALDPAGPSFVPRITSNRLTQDSARFVHVIHTSDRLGFKHPCGHADYYVNGGSVQPMCGEDLTGVCSHYMAVKYYEESLENNKFEALPCTNYYKYLSGDCSSARKSPMGGYTVDNLACGKYYLQTNNWKPFGKS